VTGCKEVARKTMSRCAHLLREYICRRVTAGEERTFIVLSGEISEVPTPFYAGSPVLRPDRAVHGLFHPLASPLRIAIRLVE